MGKGAATCDRPAMDLGTASEKKSRRTLKREKLSPKAGKYWGSVERVSKKGVPVTLKFYEGIDDGINRGWKVELIEVHAAEGPAGYLKLAYIPKESMEKFYPNALAYAVNHKNLHYGLEELIKVPEKNWGREDYLKAIEATDEWNVRREEKAARQELADVELKRLWKDHKRKVTLIHQKEYRKFKDFQQDKPYVDFIRVYEAGERGAYVDGIRSDARSQYQCSRLGIGTLLYETGALWMKARGYPMFASGLQSDEAQAVWAGFDSEGLTEKVGKRRRFNTEALIEKQPELENLFEQLVP